jgi:hypothetical protein
MEIQDPGMGHFPMLKDPKIDAHADNNKYTTE